MRASASLVPGRVRPRVAVQEDDGRAGAAVAHTQRDLAAVDALEREAGEEHAGCYRARRPASALPSVTSSAYSRSAPTGSPEASRVTATSGVRSRSAAAMCSAVASPVVVGFVASTTSLPPPASTRA